MVPRIITGALRSARPMQRGSIRVRIDGGWVGRHPVQSAPTDGQSAEQIAALERRVSDDLIGVASKIHAP
jgi:hypothetical protein